MDLTSKPVTGKPTSGRMGLKAIFLLMAAVLIGTFVSAFLIGRSVIRANEALLQRKNVIDHLDDVLSTVKDAETGQRGYLLTGDDQYLGPFLAAQRRIRSELEILRVLPLPGRSARVPRLNALIDEKLAELQQTIDLRKAGTLDAALAIVRNDRGQAVMENIRGIIGQWIADETSELNEQKLLTNQLTGIRTAVFACVVLVNLLFLYWAYRRICSEKQEREAAAADVLRQKELLGVTLSSIGDGVIVTDDQGRITFMNQVAEELTGWTAGEADGQLCTTVFNIINEDTRKLVESPVEKVLRLGVVVGLANHTLLIRKDGSEVAIDDSGAPIREDGKVRGVVLVFRDFTEHKNYEVALRQAKEEAETANLAKDNFLATLSHELRTPLTPVVGTLSEWEVGNVIPPQLLPDVQMMRRNVELEARLIDDLLDLTRIVRGKLSLNLEVADVHEMIDAVAQMYQSEIRGKRLRLSTSLNARQHYVHADPGRLQQVFWNILKNATKFTPEGGRIDLETVNDVEGNIVIHVRDTGIGIRQEMLDKLFRPFEQGDDQVVKRYGGLGLGMAISKALMDAQGGTLAAESEGEGKGATFTVSLPSVKAPERKQAAAPQSPAAAQRALNILLVEDHGDTAQVLCRLLNSLGHQVSVAETVQAAVQHVRGGSYDLLLSDIGLPDGTGIDLIRQVRETHTLPAVALTGFGMEEDITDCKDAGFNEHLTKPVSFQKLESILRQFTAKN